MCGVAGIVDAKGGGPPPPERLAELRGMLQRIAHRGPDAAGTFVDSRVAMGAVRLSINDLAHGHQPMGDGSGRWWVVYNGEIYNHLELRAELEQRGHRFDTRCDTEVALRAWIEWGSDAPAHFEGGYAFAVYDRTSGEVHLVRDRFGKRPLFYRVDGGVLRFASEMKALGALRWDAHRLASIFSKWTPFGEETPYAGVHQVSAGAVLSFTAEGPRQKIYTDPILPLAAEASAPDLESAAQRVEALLTHSVELRLRSDVEVGVLLSGGLDSSILAHLVRAQQPGRVRAFSVQFADRRYDESQEQRRVVEALGLAHHTVNIGASDIESAFTSALWHAEIPQFRTAFVPIYLLARGIAETGIKVVLSGEGADEVFLGYDIFKEARLREQWSGLDATARRGHIRNLYHYLPHFNDDNLRALEAGYARSSTDLASPLASHAARLANAKLAARLLREQPDALASMATAVAKVPGLADASLLSKAQWLEFHTLLHGYLLSSQGDRMTFAHGVEQRCPFLGSPVVSYAAALPREYLLAGDDEKHLLKRAFAGAVPAEILARRKQPYRAPDAESFRDASDGMRFVPWVEDLLASENLSRVDPVNVEAAGRFLDKLRRTPRDAVSPREDQAFMLLLSVAVLDQQMIRGALIPPSRELPPLTRAVDLTTEPSIQESAS